VTRVDKRVRSWIVVVVRGTSLVEGGVVVRVGGCAGGGDGIAGIFDVSLRERGGPDVAVVADVEGDDA